MVVTPRWVTVKITAQATGKKEKAIYEQIRTGIFPFRIKRVGRAILVSVHDLELIPPDLRDAEPQTETQTSIAEAA